MATKNDKYPFDEQSFTTSENEYYNLNFNQSKKCSTLIPVQSNSKPTNVKYCDWKFFCGTAATDFIVSDNYEDKEKLQLWNKSFEVSTFTTFNENNDDFKKRWKNENTLKTINKSTLSLHITAYENLIGAAELDENTEGLKKDKFGSIKMSKQCFADSFKSQNPFEFPRQQRGDQKNKPEAMQFKASQRLLGSSRPSSAVITMSSSSDSSSYSSSSSDSSSYSSSSSDSESQEQHGNAPKQQPIARQLCLRKTSAQGKPADEPVAKVPRLGPNPRDRDAKLLKKRKADLAKMISKLGESRTQEAAKDTPLRQPMPNDTPSIPQESTYESTKEANSYWYKIMSNERYTDTFLIASDKTKVSSHRCVLAEHSKIFAKIIEETSELPVTINVEDFDAETIKSALDFLYGKNDSIKGKENEIFKFAVTYNIKKIMDACCSYFEESVNPSNVCELIQISYSNNFEKLKQKCLKILVEKKKEIDPPKFADLPKNIISDFFAFF